MVFSHGLVIGRQRVNDIWNFFWKFLEVICSSEDIEKVPKLSEQKQAEIGL